jgi:DNA polymerase III, delta subunit
MANVDGADLPSFSFPVGDVAWLTQRQPLATRFFQAALAQGKLVHAYVLKGPDLTSQYGMALWIAQIINCMNPPKGSAEQACGQCRNCRWIADNAHPAITTLTRLTYEAEKDKRTAKKNIGTEQLNQLQAGLAKTSADVRVVIFADAEELPASHPSATPAPAEWRNLPGNEAKSLHLRPLTHAVFNDKAVNQFLKTLEEPHPNTVFFFLTDSEASLLPTIVSRCQVVPFGAGPMVDAMASGLNEAEQAFLAQWWGQVQQLRQTREPFGVVASFRAFWEDEQGMDSAYGVRQVQQWLLSQNRAGQLSGHLRGLRYVQVQRACATAWYQLANKAHAPTVLWQWLTQIA